MGEVKETLCSKCLHLWVCKYKEELLETTSKADVIFDGGTFGYVLICPEYRACPLDGVGGN